ncbi:hypothetical protein D3C72_2044030 [compost metagenome]
MLLRVTTRSCSSGALMCTVKVGLRFSATEGWSAVMVTCTRSPWLPVPGVPEPGSSVTEVVTVSPLSVSFSKLSAPDTDSSLFAIAA